MKVLELCFVFEDDDGKQYVRRFRSTSRVLLGVASSLVGHGVDLSDVGPPVLRKVTEVVGHVEDTHGDDPYIAGRWFGKSKVDTLLVDVLPDETRKDCTPYRFRVTVEAVPVKGGDDGQT